MVGNEIAQGGFSFVYRARDAMTGEAFALKKILCQTDEQMQAAKQEIQTHKSFDHPHIMPLTDYAVVTVDGSTHEYYLLFPFMEVGHCHEQLVYVHRHCSRVCGRLIVCRRMGRCGI